METQELIFFTTNIILITVSVYSCIIKWCFRPKAYREHFNRLFPGQFWVGLLFLLQLLEIPYMFEIENVKALRYNASLAAGDAHHLPQVLLPQATSAKV